MNFKVRVFANHKPIGWLRCVELAGGGREVLLTTSQTRATRYVGLSHLTAMAVDMTSLPRPDSDTPKKPLAVLTFQLVIS